MPGSGEYTVIIAKYGERRTMRSDVFLNYALYRQDDAPIGMDYFVWVLRNDEHTVLVDTGFSPRGGAIRHREQVIDVAELYAELDVDPMTVARVIVTHAHYDHIGNLGLFPNARVLMSRGEYDFWISPHSHHPLFHHSVEDGELAALAARVQDGSVDFFSDRVEVVPGVEVIEVGGHTPGQSVVRVETADGAVLIASDAVHYYEEYEAEMPFGSVADLVEMYDGFARIKEMVASGDIRHLVSGHDPDTLSRFTPVSGRLAGLAATIGGSL